MQTFPPELSQDEHLRCTALLYRDPVHKFMFDDSGRLLFANAAATNASMHSTNGTKDGEAHCARHIEH